MGKEWEGEGEGEGGERGSGRKDSRGGGRGRGCFKSMCQMWAYAQGRGVWLAKPVNIAVFIQDCCIHR